MARRLTYTKSYQFDRKMVQFSPDIWLMHHLAIPPSSHSPRRYGVMVVHGQIAGYAAEEDLIINDLHTQAFISLWANLPNYAGHISPSALGIHTHHLGHGYPWAWARIPFKGGRTPLPQEQVSYTSGRILDKPCWLWSIALPPLSQHHDDSTSGFE